MNRLFFLFCAVISLFGLSSCHTDPDAIYYVRYEATINSVHSGATAKYIVATENGSTEITSKKKTLNETFGPVKKGFTASISGEAEYDGTMTLSIYVCRGEEPFALKATKTGEVSTWGTMEGIEKPMTASVSYTIDF
ncbi:MAG: hypothetical protein J5382_09625 [Bacteroidales bacterium]|nr:hypothetical protein [Bacteroidales bacterium]